MEISTIANLQCDAFIDALATCGSHACLQQIANLINSGRASESVYSSLALLSKPKKGMMDSVAEFIEKVPLHGKKQNNHCNFTYDYQKLFLFFFQKI